MEPISTTYRKNNYEFKQVNRTGDVAIYEQREPSNNRLLGYEVFIIQHQKESILPNGLKVQAKEVTPSASSWGNLGYTVANLEQAYVKRDVLLEKVKRINDRVV